MESNHRFIRTHSNLYNLFLALILPIIIKYLLKIYGICLITTCKKYKFLKRCFHLDTDSRCYVEPWLVYLSGLSVGLWTKASLVQFPVKAHAWVPGQVPSRGRTRGNHTLVILSLSFSLPSPPSKSKKIKYFLKRCYVEPYKC